MKILLFCCALIVFNVNGECDKTQCAGEQKLYKEIGCTPVIEEGQCCPSRYECPDFSTLDNNKCHYKNQAFEVRAKLPSDMTGPLCSASCSCREGWPPGSPAKFECANIECPSLFNRPDPECVEQFEATKCCSTNKVCGDDRNALAKCVLDGREYYEGAKMYPDKESCYSCICAKDFDNTTVVGNPHCREVDCGFQLRYMSRVQTGCVPVYFGDEKCCPIGWRCPDDKKDKVEARAKNDKESTHKCAFGSLKLNVGDELNNDEEGVTCACVTPPYVQCVRAR